MVRQIFPQEQQEQKRRSRQQNPGSWKVEGHMIIQSEDKRKLKAKLVACVPQTMLISTAEPQEFRGWIRLGTLKVRFM